MEDQNPTGEELVDKLHQLLQNPDDWDGYGTPKVSSKQLVKCYSILDIICKNKLDLPSISTTCGSNGLQFEWYYGARSLEIEFTEEDMSALRSERVSEEEVLHLETLNFKLEDLSDFIIWAKTGNEILALEVLDLEMLEYDEEETEQDDPDEKE